MKKFTRVLVVAALLALPVAAHAEDTTVPRQMAASGMCPMAGDMDSLLKDIGSLAVEMNGITERTADSDMKERMQKMQEHLSLVNARVKKMHDEMENAAGAGTMASVKTDGMKKPAETK
jgi:hypothetical protein